MADKTIGELSPVDAVYDDTKIPAEQQGEAVYITGKQYREFGEATSKAYVETAVQAAKDASASKESAASAAESAGADALAAGMASEKAEKARDAIEGMIVDAVTLSTGEPASVEKTVVDDVFKLVFGLPMGATGEKGDRGSTGNGIAGIEKTSGDGSPGTIDTYTITYTDGETFHFSVYNGMDGSGAVLSVNGKTGEVEITADDIDGLSDVAKSGSYNDLDDKPSIPPSVAVKGNAENTYRTGNVNLTPANIGAYPSTGGTLSGQLSSVLEQNALVQARSTDGNLIARLWSATSQAGIWAQRYGVDDAGQWLLYMDANKNVRFLGTADSANKLNGTLGIANGGTGVTSFSPNAFLYTTANGALAFGTRSSAGIAGWNASGAPTQYASPLPVAQGGTAASDEATARSNLGVPTIQRGLITVPAGTANTVTTARITFPTKFAGVPAVSVSVQSSGPNIVYGVSVGAAAADGVDVYVYRTNSGATVVNWIAVY